jgi:hypothetical protein
MFTFTLLILGAAQKFEKFQCCMQNARSKIMSRQVPQAVPSANQPALCHQAM